MVIFSGLGIGSSVPPGSPFSGTPAVQISYISIMTVGIKYEPDYPRWFITFTFYDWKPLFELTSSYDVAYKWFTYLREHEIAEVIAFVMMPNHLHAISLRRVSVSGTLRL